MELRESEQLKEASSNPRNKMAEEDKKQNLEEKEQEKPVEKQEKETAGAPKKEVKTETKKDEKATPKTGEKKPEEKKAETKPAEKSETKTKKVPKTEAVVNSPNAHLSMKTSAAVCRFIVGKTIDQAVADLREVAAGRKAVPMKGEIPHRHGKIMSGRFPKNASEHFIMLLKTLAGNCNVNGLEEPVIAEAIANIASRPYGKFGAVRRKRAHIKIIAKNKSEWKKGKSKKNLKNKKTNSKDKQEKKK